MTIGEARARVEEIRAKSGDDEWAHSAEDEMYLAILRQLVEAKTAQEANDAALVAAIALETQDIDFQRWCA